MGCASSSEAVISPEDAVRKWAAQRVQAFPDEHNVAHNKRTLSRLNTAEFKEMLRVHETFGDAMMLMARLSRAPSAGKIRTHGDFAPSRIAPADPRSSSGPVFVEVVAQRVR